MPASSRAQIRAFLASKTLAVVGASRDRQKFGNAVFRQLRAKGYKVYPVNPNAEMIDEERCYPTLSALPEPVDGIVVVVPPAQTEQTVRQARDAGVHRVWMQNGAESELATRFCEEHSMSVVHHECILMFAEPAPFFHRMHRWVRGVAGGLPK
jgi:uncharacterized protein